jgi:hypothetical protein
MPQFEASSDAAKAQVERILKKGAEVENGKIVFRLDGAYVRIDGLKMTLESKLELMQNDPEFAFLFPKKEEVKPSKFEERMSDAGLNKAPPKTSKPDTGRFNIRKQWAGLPLT